MSITNSLIDSLVRGDHLSISRTVTNIPATTTLTKAWLSIKQFATQTDAEAIIQKIISTVSTSAGQITDSGADGTGGFTFLLLPIDTLKLAASVPYYFDIQLQNSDGTINTPELGIITAAEQITQSS